MNSPNIRERANDSLQIEVKMCRDVEKCPPTCVQRVRGDPPHDIDDFCYLTYPIVLGVSLCV